MAIARADAALLLRRAAFGGTAAEVDALAASADRATAVATILDVSQNPAPVAPPSLTDPNAGDYNRWVDLTQWWIDRMRTVPKGLQEKMTLFWHTHFATSQDKVNQMVSMYAQNDLFRTAGLGDFMALTQAMALQPAMLHYLDNDMNVKGSPNENFARELMELFTLGVNQYTQADVEASAAAWTGHSTDNATGLTYQFFSNRHDYSMKTFMDQTRAWDGPDIINYILTTDPHRTTAAQFVATKLWSFLAYPSPEPAVVSAITTAFVNSNLNITELLRAIFMRDEFYSTKARQGLVRSPTEWVVATLKATGIPATTANPQWWMDDMGQQLFYPPNVAGWKGNAYWISTTAVWSRANFAGYIGWQWHQATPVPALLVDLDAKMAGAYTLSDSAAITEALTDFMIDSPSPSLVSNLTVWLHGQRVGQGAPEYAWVDYQFLNLIPLIMLSPDFQLN